MPMRPCLDCGRPTEGSRCPSCRGEQNRARDQRRGTTTARGYGAEHQAARAAWEPVVHAGGVLCRRYPTGLCVAPDPVIQPDEPWHLGHPDRHCAAPKAPEHALCNVGAPLRKPTDRTVVLLCGPAGAGKTTAARASGLTVYDRDDDHWTGEKEFTTALAALATSQGAQAVVIRSGATSSARARAAQTIGATHVYLLLEEPAELERRVRQRDRMDKVRGVVSITSWFDRFDRDDRVASFPGWPQAFPAGAPRGTPPPSENLETVGD